MAYYSNPTNLFPGYGTDEGNYAVFPVSQLPSCSGNPNNLNDIKEILFSLLSVVDNDYANLPAYASGVNVRTKANNFSITSSVGAATGNTVRKVFTVGFTVNAAPTSVADENEFNPD
jgi:hypothetical protein